MKLTAKKITLITATVLTLGLQGISHAQISNPPASEIVTTNPQRAEVIQTTPAITQSRAPSWQGKKVAIRGRDVVSYFENEKPLKGSKDIVVEWDKTKWRFSSEKNAELFKADPHKYVPEFGGFCPVALADNNAKIGKSTHFTVIDEKLYLNYNRASKIAFRKRPNDFLVKASVNF